MRLLWRLTTPRRLRRNTLIILLAWTAVAFANQNGMLPNGSSPPRPLPTLASYVR
jgi:hypothetical protein